MGQELTEEIHEKMKDAMSEFKRRLEEFALNHRQEIRMDPEFRAHFHAMCAHVGVDPLASNKASVNKYLSFTGWSFATFYYELGVAVVEVCMKTRPQNGGLIELNKLTRLVQQRRGNAVEKISADDVLQVLFSELVVLVIAGFVKQYTPQPGSVPSNDDQLPGSMGIP